MVASDSSDSSATTENNQQLDDDIDDEFFFLLHLCDNGWQHDHYVSNIFAFAPSGLIVCGSINAPGCMHDSSVADYACMLLSG